MFGAGGRTFGTGMLVFALGAIAATVMNCYEMDEKTGGTHIQCWPAGYNNTYDSGGLSGKKEFGDMNINVYLRGAALIVAAIAGLTITFSEGHPKSAVFAVACAGLAGFAILAVFVLDIVNYTDMKCGSNLDAKEPVDAENFTDSKPSYGEVCTRGIYVIVGDVAVFLLSILICFTGFRYKDDNVVF